jgi:molecular chaperone GrpE (heat shock protein)
VKNFKDWMAEGDTIYHEALHEYQELEKQLEALENRLAAKKAELDEISRVTGKPEVQSNRKIAAHIIEEPANGVIGSGPIPAGTMARALSGRGILSRG